MIDPNHMLVSDEKRLGFSSLSINPAFSRSSCVVRQWRVVAFLLGDLRMPLSG